MAQTEHTEKAKMRISDILKGSDYALTIFTEQEVKAIELFDKAAPIATLGALRNPREVLLHPNCTQIFSRDQSIQSAFVGTNPDLRADNSRVARDATRIRPPPQS